MNNGKLFLSILFSVSFFILFSVYVCAGKE